MSKHKPHYIILLFTILTMFLLSSTNSNRTEISHTFTRGFTHTSIEDPTHFGENSRHLSLNILEVNPSRIGVHVTAPNHSATQLEMLIDQANRLNSRGYNVIGGINGDMYAMAQLGVAEGQPSCLTVIDGEIITMHSTFDESRALPVFAVDYNGEPYFGHLILRLSAELYRNGSRTRALNLSQFNRNYHLTPWDIVIFTPRISGDGIIRILTAEEVEYHGVENLDEWEFAIIELENGEDKIVAGQRFSGTIVEVVDDLENAKVSNGTVVFAGHNLMRNQRLMIGDTIKFEANIHKTPASDRGDFGEPVNHFTEIIGAYNWLVRDGAIQTEEDWQEIGLPLDWLITTAPARTGIGIREDGTILAVTVDQIFGETEGMTMPEFAQLFYELGAVQALNFDGGSSTEMIVLDENGEFITVNTPTGLYARPISTGLLFASDSSNIRGLGHSATDEIILWVLFSSLAILAASSALLGIIKLKKKMKS